MIHLVEGLNRYYSKFPDRKKGNFILRKVINSNPVVKSQKTFTAQIWFSYNGTSIVICEANISKRVVTEPEKVKIIEELSVLLTESLLEYISTKNFKELCNDPNE